MEEFVPEEINEQPQLMLSAEEASQVVSGYMRQVYTWMTVALALTGGVALFVGASPAVQQLVFGNRLVFIGLLLLELVVVGFLSRKAFDWTITQTQAAFVGYALLNGLTLGVVFMVYTADSIASTFFVTAGTFGVMSLYGYFTRTDLTRWGNLLLMGVIGLIIASVVNMFLLNSMLYTICSFVGVLLFVGLTAYDTQKLKMMAFMGYGEEDTTINQKAAVLGALTLYLDFVNLFLYILRLFGRRK
ncbi:Bax inhibitor-1/YccA family protein [Hymenobacter sp. DG25B]|uniref:Bax inhibitor-1/YccA family protein n=1 Tax=Hymenobacter sp. DG25B TaxID=1385664 RepID=UPI0005C9AFB8|nr:Bax inhibitor-1/YccA family protein [Hymenobacter sp. DG25B]